MNECNSNFGEKFCNIVCIGELLRWHTGHLQKCYRHAEICLRILQISSVSGLIIAIISGAYLVVDSIFSQGDSSVRN